jgi:hypothetical protein
MSWKYFVGVSFTEKKNIWADVLKIFIELLTNFLKSLFVKGYLLIKVNITFYVSLLELRYGFLWNYRKIVLRLFRLVFTKLLTNFFKCLFVNGYLLIKVNITFYVSLLELRYGFLWNYRKIVSRHFRLVFRKLLTNFL